MLKDYKLSRNMHIVKENDGTMYIFHNKKQIFFNEIEIVNKKAVLISYNDKPVMFLSLTHREYLKKFKLIVEEKIIPITERNIKIDKSLKDKYGDWGEWLKKA